MDHRMERAAGLAGLPPDAPAEAGRGTDTRRATDVAAPTRTARVRRGLAALAAVAALSGCGDGFRLPFGDRASQPPPGPEIAVAVPGEDTVRPQMRPGSTLSPLAAPRPAPGGAQRPETLDTTTDAERAAARAAAETPAEGASLGETVASLGSPAEQGIWLRTPLVDAIRPGRVEVAGGARLAVQLRPSGGAPGSGSQLSLAAFRALGLPLTALPVLVVYAD